jgi:hypothetical protein
MIISVVSPHTVRNGNTVSSILLAFGLGDLKRKVLLTHTSPQSYAFDQYLGLQNFEDKTSTPTQLVKLMREGAVKPEEIGDYCKLFEDFVFVFTNKETNFSQHDMNNLADFILTSSMPYEYIVFDIDEKTDSQTAEMVLAKSDLIILNLSDSSLELEMFNQQKDKIIKMCKGKKVILLCSAYDSRALKSTKELTKKIGVDTVCHTIRYNSWVKWACNGGKLAYLFKQGKTKDSDVIEIYKDSTSLASAVSKTKISIGKAAKGVFK